MKKKERKILVSLLVLFNIAIDQITKSIVRINFQDNETVYFIKDFVLLKKVENYGAVMGVGSELPDMVKGIYFKALPFIFLIYVFRMALTKPAISKRAAVGLSFTIGGGFGNLFDRFFHGSVTDLIVVNIGFIKTGVFNIADISIIIGLVILFSEILFNKNNNLYESIT